MCWGGVGDNGTNQIAKKKEELTKGGGNIKEGGTGKGGNHRKRVG